MPLARNACSLPAASSTRDGVERGRHHLAGDRALPDQFVQLALVVVAGIVATDAGVRSAEVGRIASCASCAFFDLVL